MPLKISKDTMIGELIMNYPQAVEVLYERGFHCIGCGLSAYETLEQGALAHGYDEETIEQIVKEIQAKVNEADKKGAAGAPMAKEIGMEQAVVMHPQAKSMKTGEKKKVAMSSASKKTSAKNKKSEPG